MGAQESATTAVIETTAHGDARMNERGFNGTMIRILRHLGSLDDRGCCNLTPHMLRDLIAGCDRFRKELVRLIDKGGASLVLDENGRVITVYGKRQFRPRNTRRRRHQLQDGWAEV